jgi:hypothetical protein
MESGVGMQENIRHCNDKESCIETAQDFTFLNEKFSEPTPEELEQYERDTNPSKQGSRGEGAAVVGIGIAIIIAVAAIIFGISKAVPVVAGWFDKDDVVACEELDAEATYNFCTEKGFVVGEVLGETKTDNPDSSAFSAEEQWCADNGWLLGDTCDAYCDGAIVPVSDCATLRYELPEGYDPQNVTDYVANADAIIDRMIAVKANMETLELLAKSMGSYEAAWLTAKNDKQWLAVYEEMNSEMEYLNRKFRDWWAPSPYNSSNPLLDAHGRLMVAYLNLEEAKARFQFGYYEGEGWYLAYGQKDKLYDHFDQNISHARTGLNMAR